MKITALSTQLDCEMRRMRRSQGTKDTDHQGACQRQLSSKPGLSTTTDVDK